MRASSTGLKRLIRSQTLRTDNVLTESGCFKETTLVLTYKRALPYEPQRRKEVEYYLVATTEFEPGSVERSGYSYPLVDLDEQVHEPTQPIKTR